MLPVEKYINTNAVISDGHVQKNGQTLFENRDADLAEFLLSLYIHTGSNYPRFYKMDTLSKLGWLASEILLQGNFYPGEHLPEETGLIMANSNASLDTDLKYFESLKVEPSPSLFVYTLPNILLGEISIRNDFKGESAFFVSDDFDPAFMHQYVSWLLDNDRLKVCIMGWVDVLNEQYKAVLMKVEKEKAENSIPFTIENINTIFRSTDE